MKEHIAKLREDPNLWRTFVLGQKYYQKREQTSAPILDFLILVIEQLLMAHLGISIETAEELLKTPVEPDDVIKIGKDLKGAFDKLCGMYPTAKEFAKEANLSTSTISLLKSGKRRLTVDRMIRLCKDCGKKYIVV